MRGARGLSRISSSRCAAPAAAVAALSARLRLVSSRVHAFTVARHISRHINILYSALYREDKKHVCSSAYQMLSPSLFVCQLNATSARRRTPRLLVGAPLDSPTPKPPKPTPERAIQPAAGYPPLFRFSYVFLPGPSVTSPSFLLAVPSFIFRVICFRVSSCDARLVPAGSPPFRPR